MSIAYILYPAVLYGAIISVVMSAIVYVSLRWNAEMWLHDAPPKIRERYGPVSNKSKRESQLVAIPVFLSLGAILAYAVAGLYRQSGGPPGFWPVFLTLFVAMQTFNVFDLLVLDWLFLATLRLKAWIIPGTENWEGWGDYGFYGRGFLKGCVGISVVCVAVAGILALLGRATG